MGQRVIVERRGEPDAVALRRGAEHAWRSGPGAARGGERVISSSSSSAAMACTAWSNSAIWAGNTSRNRPEDAQRDVDARPRQAGIGQDLEAGDAGGGRGSQVGAHAEMGEGLRKVLARRCAWWRRPTGRARSSAASRRGPAHSARPPHRRRGGRRRRRCGSARRAGRCRRGLRPVGSTSVRPRDGAPAGPPGTKRPARAPSRPSRSPVAHRRPARVARSPATSSVMAGLVPAIQAAPLRPCWSKGPQCPGVDGRDKPGHDGDGAGSSEARPQTCSPSAMRIS